MTLIVIIASVFLDRCVDVGKSLRSLEFINQWLGVGLSRVRGSYWLGLLVVLSMMLVPAVVAWWIDGWVGDLSSGVLTFIWSVAVLFVCFGPLPLEAEAEAYLQAVDSGEEVALNNCAQRLVGRMASAGGATTHSTVMRAIFAQANTQIVTVVFWFAVLGPFAAVLYRVALQLVDKSADSVQINEKSIGYLLTFIGVLTWLPARMLMLAYALAGKFDGTLVEMLCPGPRAEHASLFECNNAALSDAGMAALALPPGQSVSIGDIRAAKRLVVRALVICAVSIALLTLPALIPHG